MLHKEYKPFVKNGKVYMPFGDIAVYEVLYIRPFSDIPWAICVSLDGRWRRSFMLTADEAEYLQGLLNQVKTETRS